MVPLTVPVPPPGHATVQPEPQPVTVQLDEHVTSHDDASAQSTFAVVAADAFTAHG